MNAEREWCWQSQTIISMELWVENTPITPPAAPLPLPFPIPPILPGADPLCPYGIVYRRAVITPPSPYVITCRRAVGNPFVPTILLTVRREGGTPRWQPIKPPVPDPSQCRTLHPILQPPNPTPCTLHRNPCNPTPNPTPCTLHRNPFKTKYYTSIPTLESVNP